MKKCITILLLSFFALSNTIAQNDYSTVHPSPNIGWGLANLSQANDLYTGSARLNIPLFEMNSGSVKLPISLGYTTKSIPVDQLPSWVGIGWNLSIGGQISRTVNGAPDEFRDTKPRTMTYVTVFPDGSSSSSRSSAGELTVGDYSYWINHSMLHTPQWAAPSYLQNTLGQMPYVEADPNEYIYVTSSGSTVVPNPIAYYSYSYDFEPDIFHFTIGSISGSFFLNQEGKWICETKEGNYSVEPLIANNIPKGNIKIARAIYGFTLTAPDGVKYMFGGTSTDYLKNNEFWRGPTNIDKDAIFNAFPYFPGFVNACPSNWYITRIETPDNNAIDFSYKKGSLQVQYSEAQIAKGDATLLSRDKPGYIQQSLTEPWYLTNIKCSNGVEVEVASENSQQLGTDVNIENLCPYTGFQLYDIGAVLKGAKNNFLKVTSLKIKHNGETKKEYKFEYIENNTERLKLQYIKEVSRDAVTSNQAYRFEYASGKLPPYGSGLVDHFGYYNNKKFFTDKTQKQFNITRIDFDNQYYLTREPVFSYAQYEVLQKVHFPGGGRREYVYEPHDYGSKINRWPFNVVANSITQETGGVRVAKIIDFTEDDKKADEVSFIYKPELNSSSSSGVFSIPTIKYTKDLSVSGTYEFEARSFTPFDRVQSHITYSTVYEMRSDNSFKKYDFWNYDNGANDNEPLFETIYKAYNDGQTFTNYSFKRGNIKYITNYNNAGQPIQKQSYNYQHEVDNYTRFIKAVRLSHNNSSGTGFKAAAYQNYYFPNFLRKEQSELKSDDLINSIITAKEYEYDVKNNLVALTVLNSNGQQIETQYRYPYNLSSSDNNNPYTKLVQKNIINAVVEEKKLLKKNGQNYLIGAILSEYSSFDNGILKPKAIYKSSIKGPVLLSGFASTIFQSGSLTFDSRYSFSEQLVYNGKGKVVETKNKGGQKSAIVWDHAKNYPIAKVQNASYDQVAYTSFETDDYGGWNLNNGGAIVNHTVITGRKSYTGSINKTLPQGNYKVTLWATGNASVNGIAGTVVKANLQNSSWGYYEWKLTNVTNIAVTATNMDEVRLYPEEAQMTTYTYEPLVGMTAQVDIDGRISYYEYDGLGRLSYTKDEASNIIKRYCYNYQGQITLCDKAYKNEEISKIFTRHGCPAGTTGGTIAYVVPTGEYISFLSQEDANQKALANVNAKGQAYANANGPCYYYNVAKTGNPTRTACGSGYVGTTVIYTVPARTYASTISQADADSKAQADIDANGQTYANANGSCVVAAPNIAVKYSNQVNVYWSVKATNLATGTIYSATTGSMYSGTLFSSLPSGMYTISFASSGQTISSYPVLLTVNGATQLIQPPYSSTTMVTFSNVIVTSGSINPLITTKEILPPPSCGLAASSGWQLPAIDIYASGSVVNINLSVRVPSGSIAWSSFNTIATITGSGCYPSGSRTFTTSENGRTWEVVVSASGQMSIRLLSGMPPASGTTFYITKGGAYTL
jgi:hypothetical protein